MVARLFVYLTDCERGGGTHFHQTSLPPLQPRRGLACVFLQATLDRFDAAPRLSHKGLPAVDEKATAAAVEPGPAPRAVRASPASRHRDRCSAGPTALNPAAVPPRLGVVLEALRVRGRHLGDASALPGSANAGGAAIQGRDARFVIVLQSDV